MFATGLFVLAATLQFNGIMGQSAVPGDPPLTFTGVRALTEGPGGRLLLTGDDGVLYALVDGEVVSLGVRVPAAHLAWDGRTLWALGSDAVWTVDEECPGCFAAHKAFDVPGLRFDQAAVRPELADHPFAGKGKFFRWDRGRNVLVAHDAAGRECGTVFAFPRRKGDSALVALGFLPGTEDLVASSYYPDVRLYRFRVDGSQVTGNGSANRGYVLLRRFKGRLYWEPTCCRWAKTCWAHARCVWVMKRIIADGRQMVCVIIWRHRRDSMCESRGKRGFERGGAASARSRLWLSTRPTFFCQWAARCAGCIWMKTRRASLLRRTMTTCVLPTLGFIRRLTWCRKERICWSLAGRPGSTASIRFCRRGPVPATIGKRGRRDRVRVFRGVGKRFPGSRRPSPPQVPRSRRVSNRVWWPARASGLSWRIGRISVLSVLRF